MTTPTPVNYWPQSSCAKAFWGQQELPPYQELLQATVRQVDPQPDEHWLDLGCGGGALTKALWRASEGRLAKIVGLDCAAANEHAYAKHRARLQPSPGERIHFVAADFSAGLPLSSDYFDGVVSGLAIQYAESYASDKGVWTTAGYEHLLEEVHRVLRPGGRFVFSVNVPNPSWAKVALASVLGPFVTRHPLRFLQKAWAMWNYGGWLKREARKGRFHYLHRSAILPRLKAAGFINIEFQRSFARQAYVFRCWKPL